MQRWKYKYSVRRKSARSGKNTYVRESRTTFDKCNKLAVFKSLAGMVLALNLIGCAGTNSTTDKNDFKISPLLQVNPQVQYTKSLEGQPVVQMLEAERGLATVQNNTKKKKGICALCQFD